jgi:hypothetical protein
VGEFVQFVAGGPGEFGVQGQYLDGELHLVDDALAGAVARTEQFKIADFVVGAVPVFVMDGFFGEQVATDVTRHRVSVFHDMPLPVFASRKFGYVKPDVTVSFCVLFVAAGFEFVQRVLLLAFYLAVMIAVFLLCVVATAWFSALRPYGSACKARESVFAAASFTAACARALSRAVPRISFVFLMVRINKRLHHGKFLVAFAASKFQDGLSNREFLVEAVRASARKTAIFPVFTRETGKRLLAIFTDFLNRHRLAPLFGDEGTLSMSIGDVK